MKKLIMISCFILMITFTSCESKYSDELPEYKNPDSSENIELEDDNINTKKGSTNVTITIPASMFEDAEPDDVIENAKEEGITASLNDDGSYNYEMSKSKHSELMKDMNKTVKDSISEMLEEQTYSSVSNISYNNDFTEFNIYANQEEYENNFLDSFAILTVGIQGMYYQTFNGTPDNKVTINVINSETDEVFNTVIYPDAFNN